MQFRAKDYYFVFSLSFMIILIILISLRQIRQNRLNDYLDLMHQKLSEMIENEETRKQLDKIYREFTEQARDGDFDSEEIEKVADSIIELKKTKNKVAVSDIKKILPEKKSVSAGIFSPLLESAASIDWQMLARRFEDSCRSCDSLKTVAINTEISNKLFESQIKLHEKISRIHQTNAQSARQDFNRLQEQLSKLDYLPEKMENELKDILYNLELENKKLNAKINSIDKIKDQMQNEREKLAEKLSRLDSISAFPSVN